MDIIGNRTLRDLWHDLARRHADDTFLVFEDRAGHVSHYRYAEFDRLINRSANLLHSLGIGHGDMVALHLHNCPELIMCSFALAKLGAVSVPLHPRNSRAECADIIGKVAASAVICEPGLVSMYTDADRIPVGRVLVARNTGTAPTGTAPSAWTMDAHGAGSAPLPAAVVHFESERDAQPAELIATAALSSDDPALIVFTSGSTAAPKGVVLTHCNLLFSGVFVNWEAAFRSTDRLLTTMPACHVNFQLNALMPVLTAGAQLIVVERFRASTFWRQVCTHRATIVQSIAMMVRTQLLQPEAEWEKNNDVREVLYYLPISNEEKTRFEQRFGTRILNSYGTSETLVGVITDPPHGERRWPSVGRVGLGYEARIADDDGRELPPGALGEIQIRGVPGRTVMKEYYQAPEATAALFDADGWMHTGDVGYTDEDGWFYFHGRKTTMIKRAGENIAPAEVETVLTEHPLIAEAAVFGVPDPIYDEAVKAVVVLVHGAVLAPAEIRSYCRSRLAAFKVPTEVDIAASLPRTATFKVATNSLKPPTTAT